jgi:enhancing lycopene biosynthesis protein 2
MKDMKAVDLDALIFPGGYGAAKNLCTFAVDGVNCKVNPEVERLVKEMHGVNKPIGFICIAPVIAAKVLGHLHPKLTIGDDQGTAQAIEQMGARHVACKVDEVTVDDVNKIVSTPAYMLGPNIALVAKGIEKCVEEVLTLIK